MAGFDVITDSTSDLTLDLRQEYNIDYFQMGFSSSDKEYSASLDWDEIGSHEFYDSMRNGVKYKTSQVSVKTFTEKLKKHLSGSCIFLFYRHNLPALRDFLIFIISTITKLWIQFS